MQIHATRQSPPFGTCFFTSPQYTIIIRSQALHTMPLRMRGYAIRYGYRDAAHESRVDAGQQVKCASPSTSSLMIENFSPLCPPDTMTHLKWAATLPPRAMYCRLGLPQRLLMISRRPFEALVSTAGPSATPPPEKKCIYSATPRAPISPC